MKIYKKQLINFILVLFISFVTLPVSAESYRDFDLDKPSAGEMFGDLLFVRPMMILVTAVGTVTYVASLPFSLLGGNTDEVARVLVVEPAKYTFIRPLGDIRQK